MEVEIDGSFSWENYYYGDNNVNQYNSNIYMASLALAPWSLTAFQFDFLQGQTILLADQDYPAGVNNSVVYNKTDVETQTYGFSLRQAFTGSQSFIRPMVSLGWARRFSLNSGYTDYRDNSSGEVTRVYQPEQNLKQDLTSLGLYLKIRVFNGFFLSLSLRTLFEGFQIAKANQNLRFFVGISWLL